MFKKENCDSKISAFRDWERACRVKVKVERVVGRARCFFSLERPLGRQLTGRIWYPGS